MSLLNLIDVRIVEPLIRRWFPAPKNKRIRIRKIRNGRRNARILFLCGAFCADARQTWSGWVRDIEEHFNDLEIVALDGYYYYWEEDYERINNLIRLGIDLVSDNKPTYIVSFSFGGLIAKGIIDQAKTHRVECIISMATEHRGHLPRISSVRDDLLNIPLDVNVPLFTFGGIFDAIVWPWTTYTNCSKHSFFPVGHFAFVRSRKVRTEIMRILYDFIQT